MAMNLVLQRGGRSIWDRRRAFANWDLERWLASLAAGGLLVAGLRRRSAARWIMIAASGALAWWALCSPDARRQRRGQLRSVLLFKGRSTDIVLEASEESFPASDAPAWTPTTGNTAPPAG